MSARERQLPHAYSTRGSLSRSLARCAQQTALACATIVSSSRSRATHHSHTRYINVLAGWLCATFGSSAFRTQENKKTNQQTNKHLKRRDGRGFVLWPNFTLWGWGTNSRLFLLYSTFSVSRFVCVSGFLASRRKYEARGGGGRRGEMEMRF